MGLGQSNRISGKVSFKTRQKE